MAAAHQFSADRRDRAWQQTNGHCWYCGEQPTSSHQRHADHVVAHSSGGTYRQDNLRAACGSCNGKKRDKTTEQFRQYLQDRRFNAIVDAIDAISRSAFLCAEDSARTIADLERILGAIENTPVIFWGETWQQNTGDWP